MTNKKINAYLKYRFNKFLKTIKDGAVKDMVRKNSIITGGAIASLLVNEAPKDIDIYFTDKKTVKAVAKYYCDEWNILHPKQQNKLGKPFKAYVLDGGDAEQMAQDTLETMGAGHLQNMTPGRIKIVIRSDGIASEQEELEPFADVLDQADDTPADALEKKEDEKNPDYRPIFLSPNAVTLSGKVQLIVRFYGTPAEIHQTYDFVHCTNYWESATGCVVLNQPALESILQKRLYYKGSKYPICSVIRTRKFLRRGWHINAGQYIKMVFQISELDLTDIDVLEDQLVGVDSAYFQMLIMDMRANMEKEGQSFNMSGDYVCSVIDKVFGD